MNLSSFSRSAALFLAIVGARYIVPSSMYALPPSPNPSPKQSAQSRTQTLSNPLNDLLKEAQHDIDNNQFEAAIAPLQKLLAEKPDIAWAHFQLAYAYTALKRTDEARAEYERATALDPKMSEAYLNLGILLTEKDPAAAVAPLRKAVDLLPAQSRPRFLLGYALERSGDIPGATGSYEAALHLDPRDTETVVHLGNLYYGLKKYPEAEAKYRSVLESQPKSAQALLGLAQSLDAQKKPEAAAAYRDYLAVNPNDSRVRTRLMRMLLEQKQYDEALAELDRADAGGKAPTLDSLRARADIQIAQKKWDDSIVTLQKSHRARARRRHASRRPRPRLHAETRFSRRRKRNQSRSANRSHQSCLLERLSSTYYLAGNWSAAISTLDLIAKVGNSRSRRMVYPRSLLR